MDEVGSLRRLPALGARQGGQQGSPQQGRGHGRRAHGPDTDRVELSAGGHVALPLWRERALALARTALGLDPVRAEPAAQDEPTAHDPPAARHRVLQDLRELAAHHHLVLADHELERLCTAGALAAERILRDVGRLDDPLAHWFAAARNPAAH